MFTAFIEFNYKTKESYLSQSNREEKSLRHVVTVAKIMDYNKQKKSLKSLFALFQTSTILLVSLA